MARTVAALRRSSKGMQAEKAIDLFARHALPLRQARDIHCQ